MNYRHFDVLGDEALRYLERMVRESSHIDPRLDVELENFASQCRSELQHRAAEHDLVGVII